MASDSFYKKILNAIDITHIPSLLLIVGYPVFWMELFYKWVLRVLGRLLKRIVQLGKVLLSTVWIIISYY